MPTFKITGVWKNPNNVITHYAVHTVQENSTSRAEKMTKAETIALVEKPANSAYTWLWNYTKASWDEGKKVEVVNGSNGKYLRTDRDSTVTDNLQHLIDFDWIFP